MKGEGGVAANQRVLEGCIAEEIERFGTWQRQPEHNAEAQLAANLIQRDELWQQRVKYSKLIKKYKHRWRRAVRRMRELGY